MTSPECLTPMSTPPPSELQPDPAANEAQAAAVVYGWMLEGHTKGDIADAASRLWAHLDRAKVILSALEAFAVASQEPPDSIRGFCIEATRHLYRKLLAVGDYTGALSAVKQLNGFTAKPAVMIRIPSHVD